MISIKHKELIQHYETHRDYSNSYDRCIKIDEDNNIYFLYSDSSSFKESESVYFYMFKLDEYNKRKIFKCQKNLTHENYDKGLNIYIINNQKSFFIAEGRAFICDEYDLDEINDWF